MHWRAGCVSGDGMRLGETKAKPVAWGFGQSSTGKVVGARPLHGQADEKSALSSVRPDASCHAHTTITPRIASSRGFYRCWMSAQGILGLLVEDSNDLSFTAVDDFEIPTGGLEPPVGGAQTANVVITGDSSGITFKDLEYIAPNDGACFDSDGSLWPRKGGGNRGGLVCQGTISWMTRFSATATLSGGGIRDMLP